MISRRLLSSLRRGDAHFLSVDDGFFAAASPFHFREQQQQQDQRQRRPSLSLRQQGRRLHDSPLMSRLSAPTLTPSTSCLLGRRTASTAASLVATASFDHGLVHLSVPLPSRDENCRFTVKPVSSTVGELLDALKAEDRGIESAGVYTDGGVRIARSTPIHSVLNQDFELHINDRKVDIQGLEDFRSIFASPVDDRLNEVKKLIAHLHNTLNITDHQFLQEQRLVTQLENLRAELAPFEEKKLALEHKAHARTKRMTWMGLGLMGIQFGFLARLTWWEYSWDVMEPVTYFVTYGTIMIMYAYFCVTRQEYEFSAAYDREYLKWFHFRAPKVKFDVAEYNRLKEAVAQAEFDLRRLRDPLQKNVPLPDPN